MSLNGNLVAGKIDWYYRAQQISMDVKMRADAFAAFGALSNYAVGPQREAFVEQVKSCFIGASFFFKLLWYIQSHR